MVSLRGPPLVLEDVLIDDNQTFFFMELMKQGDLQQVIVRAGNKGGKLPSRLLWKGFACRRLWEAQVFFEKLTSHLVIRGCIAMRYPPRLGRIKSRTEEDWKPQDGPAVLEQVPEVSVRDSRDYDLIHFDLDPQNSEPWKTRLRLTCLAQEILLTLILCSVLLGDFDNLGHAAVP